MANVRYARLFLAITISLPTFSLAQSWVQLSPTNPPGPTGEQPAAYDPATDRMIVFGANDNGAFTNEVWVLTNADGLGGTPGWLQLAPLPDPVNGFPAPRELGATGAAYDSVNNRLTIMDGCLGFCLPVASDAWILSNANGLGGAPQWSKLFPTGGPPGPRVGEVVAYDPNTNSMMVFAGQNGCCATPVTYSDVWVLSNANGLGGTPNWTQLNPTGGPPPGQEHPSGVYDPATNRLIVMGGWLDQTLTPTNAVWVLSNANGQGGAPAWTNLVAEGAAGSPPARRDHAGVYDQTSNSMLIFGGTDASQTLLNDTWVLSNANGLSGSPVWTQLNPTGTIPAPRAALAAVFEAPSSRVTIFGGGGATSTFNDTWVLAQASICLLYDPTHAVKSGATMPIKLELCDANGNDLSSSAITLNALSVTQISSSTSGPVEDAGNANPDNNFRFDASLGTTGGYIFNLKTSGLTTGTYTLDFTVSGQPFSYATQFQVK